jgi:CheY-like chemotaxis protein
MRTLLIVDDHDSVLRTLEYVMSLHGYETVLASSGKGAIAVSEGAKVDAALVDLHMPGMDGFQTCAELITQTRVQGRTLPVWLMSAAATGAAKNRAVEVGAVALLSKPFDCAEFISGMEAHFQSLSAPGILAQAPPA